MLWKPPRFIKHLLRMVFSRTLWSTLAALAVVVFFAAGAFAVHAGHEPFPFSLLFGGNETKQVFASAGLISLAVFMVAGAKKASNMLKPGLWFSFALAFELWRWNENTGHAGPAQHVFDIVAFANHNPRMGGIVLAVAILAGPVIGTLHIFQAPVVRGTQFGHGVKDTWLSRTLKRGQGGSAERHE